MWSVRRGWCVRGRENVKKQRGGTLVIDQTFDDSRIGCYQITTG